MTQGANARGGGAAAALFSCTFVLLAALLVPLAYLSALMGGVLVPSGGPLGTSRLDAALCSPVTLAILAVLALLAAGGVVLACARRLRGVLLALGLSLVAVAALTTLVALLWAPITGLLGDAWGQALAGTSDFYASWALPCACVLAAVGAVLLSAYVSVRLVERSRA
ncbi:hypothetical protein H6A07_05945 [Olsenella uli]|uniref:hypothetical protein n=1 Tax=Olsenella uli TaxID=133926 RepID=UPI00195E0B60|nr:hypothetical protein [Olsenella uli]MBM6676283.1 hypothetical protein [Olsenella uli]